MESTRIGERLAKTADDYLAGRKAQALKSLSDAEIEVWALRVGIELAEIAPERICTDRKRVRCFRNLSSDLRPVLSNLPEDKREDVVRRAQAELRLCERLGRRRDDRYDLNRHIAAKRIVSALAERADARNDIRTTITARGRRLAKA